ncbi:magnesium transporter [Candidatus Peregrinibacteria bacterium]|nr:magnesium transporter [Candidatus Peregrinibacteria bacterium]
MYADDTRERITQLLKLRLPWLIVGLLGGIGASYLMSRFETILSKNISLAFFVPFIVYMSDAVGTQTETIFVRNMAKGKPHFAIYIIKEFFLGIILGILFGSATGLFAYAWLGDPKTALTVGLAMLVNVAAAPVIALIIPEILFKEHTDPALGGGPFTTIVQDILSILIYFLIASAIIF